MNKTSTNKKNAKLRYQKMNEGVDDVNEFPYTPGNNVINNILNYSKVLSIKKTNNFGDLGMILN
jgi:hypothetical protein